MSELVTLETAAATEAAGHELAAGVLAGEFERLIIYLRGDLGAGKTTLARGFLAGLGYAGRVPSPTYTLVEPYDLERLTAYHIDLYRLSGAAAVDELGLTDLDGARVVLLIEWPERAGGRLEAPDLELTLAIAGAGRALRYEPRTAAGKCLLAHKNV